MTELGDVLVVDDEEVVRACARLVLGGAGWRVTAVADGASALAAPVLDGCRLVLCDMMLRGQSGLDVVREIRRRRPALPIILITGYATPEHAARAQEAGATAFLPKPFDEAELLDQVRLVLASGDETAEEGRP